MCGLQVTFKRTNLIPVKKSFSAYYSFVLLKRMDQNRSFETDYSICHIFKKTIFILLNALVSRASAYSNIAKVIVLLILCKTVKA